MARASPVAWCPGIALMLSLNFTTMFVFVGRLSWSSYCIIVRGHQQQSWAVLLQCSCRACSNVACAGSTLYHVEELWDCYTHTHTPLQHCVEHSKRVEVEACTAADLCRRHADSPWQPVGGMLTRQLSMDILAPVVLSADLPSELAFLVMGLCGFVSVGFDIICACSVPLGMLVVAACQVHHVLRGNVYGQCLETNRCFSAEGQLHAWACCLLCGFDLLMLPDVPLCLLVHVECGHGRSLPVVVVTVTCVHVLLINGWLTLWSAYTVSLHQSHNALCTCVHT